MKIQYQIKEAGPNQYPAIEKILEAQGLENNKTDVKVLKGYLVRISDHLIGGAEVMLQSGEYTFSIAIHDRFQGTGIGTLLYGKIKEDIRTYGAKRILIQAKTPAFWLKNGFKEVINSNSVPDTFRCEGCEQYKKSCFPKIMVLELM